MLAGVPLAFALSFDPSAVINRCSGSAEPLYGMATDQSNPTRFSRLSTNPVVCRKGDYVVGVRQLVAARYSPRFTQ